MWPELWQRVLELTALTLSYWVLDVCVRRGTLVVGLERVGVRRMAPVLVWAVCAVSSPLWTWERVPGGDALRWLGLALAGLVAWHGATRDIDVVTGRAHGLERWLALVAGVTSVYSPWLLLGAAVVLTRPLGMWQHHSTLPMRLVQALLGYVLWAALSPVLLGRPAALADFLWFGTVLQVSHYVITALAKGFLGPRWYSWPKDNRLHHIAASAYSWGWARFIPWSSWLRVIQAVRQVERPLQYVVFLLEGLAPLALLDVRLAIALSLAFAGFHLGVFALSGLLFWEWVAVDLLWAWLLWRTSSAEVAGAFGWLPLALGLLLMFALPLRHKLWKPMPLGWWDTPFTQRMHWRVYGPSGRAYGLYADFMDPHERIYGKVHGCFLSPVPVLTYHLGEAWRYQLRDGLRESAGDPTKIDALRQQFGIQPRDAVLAANHRAYLERFCWELNRGATKAVLPRWLRWCKAPGGQCYYWGDLPAYRRQEPIERVRVVYREEYFDGHELRLLHEETVLELEVPDSETRPPAAVEPTPKELDDHLMRFAKGRLIMLPGFGDGLVQGDDGQRAVVLDASEDTERG